MRVLLVAGVGERPEARLFPALASRGIQVDLLCDTTSPYFADLSTSSFPVSHLRMRARVDIQAIRMIRSRLIAHHFDIVHAFNGRALSNSLLASVGMRVKRVGYCGTTGHLHRWDPSVYLSLLNPSVDRIVCLSDAVVKYLSSLGLPMRKLVRIYKGHDPVWFPKTSRESLTQFGIPAGAFVIGCTVNARPIKGLPILLEAFARLPQDGSFHMLLVGQDGERVISRWLRRDAVRSHIHCVGFRMDAPVLMGACDIFVMPTLKNEGLSKAVLESMCMGVPPVVTSVGGMVELVDDGVTGRIVPPGNAAALNEAILAYASNPIIRAHHGHAAYERVLSHFPFSRMVDETVNLYSSLMQAID